MVAVFCDQIGCDNGGASTDSGSTMHEYIRMPARLLNELPADLKILRNIEFLMIFSWQIQVSRYFLSRVVKLSPASDSNNGPDLVL